MERDASDRGFGSFFPNPVADFEIRARFAGPPSAAELASAATALSTRHG